MKHLLIIAIIAVVLMPVPLFADEISYEEAWAFLYGFSLTWQDGAVTQPGSYSVTSGETTELIPGAWSLVILDGNDRLVREYAFDPASMAADGVIYLKVPLEYRGATAQVLDPARVPVVTINLRESRVCNDDGMCNASAGERSENCPTDCGAVAAATPETRVAAIAPLTLGAFVGDLALKAAFAAAGLMMLIGVARMLDSRHRA